ncbi:MAG: DUF3788 family protein [Acidobacteriaceae bacterium]
MQSSNAFIGHPQQPSEPEILAALGPSADAWTQFIDWLAREHCVTGQEWKSFNAAKYGWSLRLKQKARNIVYLGPCAGSFQVSFVLGDKAMNAARHAHLPKAAATALQDAPHYAEGYGVRLRVKNPRDLPSIRTLAAIKLAN